MAQRKAVTLSVFEFFKRFPDEQAALNFIEEEYWPNGPICSFCGGTNITPRPKRKGHHCNAKNCGKDFTVRIGTIFEKSKLSLKKWLYAMYLLETSRKSISSMQLSKEMGTTQKTAWFALHRIREACNAEGSKLKGIVEVDETYMGGKEKNKHSNKQVKHSQGGANKTIVMGMRERGGKVKAQVINNTKTSTLQSVLSENVDKDTLLMTDELRGYKGVEFTRLSVNHSAKEYVNGMAHTNGIESVWAVLKRGYNGTFHHLSKKHLQRYVDEFTFRLNEGNVRIDTIDRIKSVVKNATGKRLTYKSLIQQ